MIARHPIVTEDLDQIIALPLPWELFARATVVVTGASGLLAGGCCETLLRLNELGRLAPPVRIVALSRRREALARRFAAYAGRSDLIICPGDVRVWPPAWTETADYVIHGASPASPAAMAADFLGTFEANVNGTRNMLELARKSRARKFLFLSSGAVYGNLVSETPRLQETDFGAVEPRALRAAYEEGKRAGETLCFLYADKFGLSAPAARIAHTYGPGLRPGDDRSFADFISAAIERRPLVLNSDGSAVRYFCYLSDALAGLFTILLRDNDGLAYNVGSETNGCSILDLARLIVELFPERGLAIQRSSQILDSGQAAATSIQRPTPLDTSRLRALGWTERTKLAEGLRRAVLAGASGGGA